MRVAVDAWAPGFGPAAAAGDDMRPASGPVDVGREVHADDWAPRTPDATTAVTEDVRFVDGVRRIDARIWAWDDPDEGGTPPHTHAAIAVSYGAGTVRCNEHAVVDRCEIRRELICPADLPPLTAGAVTYAPIAVPGSDDDALVAEAQQRMRALEITVARQAAAALTVVDGPLSGRHTIPGAIGYVKTHQTAYLPPVVEGVVPALAPGQRTPVFLTQTSWSRWSWYLRLPGAPSHPWAGVVRIEASAELRVGEVAALADVTAATLPRFASQPHRDPRAPQNLLPIAGLERALKRRLGDPGLMERRLRQAAALVAPAGSRQPTRSVDSPRAASAPSPTSSATVRSSSSANRRST